MQKCLILIIMPRTKNAIIRYLALDRCLRNHQRRFYLQDLIDACNKALAEVNGTRCVKGAEGVQRRQIFDDLNFMEDPLGYDVTIDRIKDGRKTYYRYAAGSKTIKDLPIRQEEVDMLHDAIMLLKRFDGVPQFDWLSEVESRLYTTSKLGEDTDSVVSFQHNPYLKGMKWYKSIFDMIVNKRVVEVEYHPFGKEARKVRVSPYYLKQYNNRWFLIGKHDGCTYLSNYAIDRIDNITETTDAYQGLPAGFDFDEYFSDVVGVSVTSGPVEEIELHVNDKTIGYVVTKPLHESQCARPEKLKDGKWKVTLKAQVNYELLSLIRSFGDGIEVVSPASLRMDMKGMVERMVKLYE